MPMPNLHTHDRRNIGFFLSGDVGMFTKAGDAGAAPRRGGARRGPEAQAQGRAAGDAGGAAAEDDRAEDEADVAGGGVAAVLKSISGLTSEGGSGGAGREVATRPFYKASPVLLRRGTQAALDGLVDREQDRVARRGARDGQRAAAVQRSQTAVGVELLRDVGERRRDARGEAVRARDDRRLVLACVLRRGFDDPSTEVPTSCRSTPEDPT